MKVKRIVREESGLSDMHSRPILQAIENSGKYQFNRSHSVAYSVISYWSMWLKVHYPAEFFAAAMSVLDTDKLPDLVHAAESAGLKVLPPDVNRSTRHFAVVEEAGEVALVAPLDAIKGVAGAAVDAILEAREEKPFEHIGDFLQRVNKTRCNKRVQSVLDRVGAFARLGETPKGLRETLELKYPWISFDQSPVTSNSRQGDQLELLPGLVRISSVSRVISRDADINRALDEKVVGPIFGQVDRDRPDQWRIEPCQRCSYAGAPHVPPRFGRTAKAVVVTDCPTYGEEDKGKMVEGLGSEYVREALEAADLSVSDFYWTTLVKSRKPKQGRLKPDEIGACSSYLDQELSVLRPGLIVALGSNTTKYLVKGSKFTQDDAGKVVFVESLNAAVVVGINPQSAFINPDSQSALNGTFEKVAELLR